jgi:hypothetical protein
VGPDRLTAIRRDPGVEAPLLYLAILDLRE